MYSIESYDAPGFARDRKPRRPRFGSCFLWKDPVPQESRGETTLSSKILRVRLRHLIPFWLRPE
jgi:hypothetical protein